MKKFAIGVICGFVLGLAGAAAAAQMVGEAGYLFGWDVVIGGESVCHDPYISVTTQEIECD